jgi:hypothetical protein
MQPHTDAYFHAVSLNLIAAELDTGSAATCGAVVAATNHAPVVATVSEQIIPMHTPFVLTGAATDADGDALTYAWEEMDVNGAAAPPNEDEGTRPIFRSFTPTSSPLHMFPRRDRVLAHDVTLGIPSGGQISGETWAVTTRDMKFRLTVRDNHSGGGASATTDTVVHVTASAGPFLVTRPTANTLWPTGGTKSVLWNPANTAAVPVSCASVDVLYSSDGGQTFGTVLATAVPNSGTAAIVVPNTPTTTARVQVLCHNGIFFDISPNDFVVSDDVIYRDGFEVTN